MCISGGRREIDRGREGGREGGRVEGRKEESKEGRKGQKEMGKRERWRRNCLKVMEGERGCVCWIELQSDSERDRHS